MSQPQSEVRKYGEPSYSVALLHGGPGACGELSALSLDVSRLTGRGILEPWQTIDSVDGQLEELKWQLDTNAALPLTLVGYSWGAWLALMFAAKNPEMVSKLLLLSCGPLEEKYAVSVESTRMSRLSREEQSDYTASLKALSVYSSAEERYSALLKLRMLSNKCDCLDPLSSEDESDSIAFRSDIFKNVWSEASALRQSGALLDYADLITCPVLAMHGDYDPHPAEGVFLPLSKRLEYFIFIELKNCGHVPWRERGARDEFMRRLSAALT